MIIEEIKELTLQEFEEIKCLMTQLSERLIIEQDDLKRVMTDSNSHLFVMRNTEGHIIGSATLSIFNSPSSRKASIEDVIVHSYYRGQHLGKELVEHIISVAKIYAPIEIHLTSKPKRIEANKLYQSLGFEKKETNTYRLILF